MQLFGDAMQGIGRFFTLTPSLQYKRAKVTAALTKSKLFQIAGAQE